MCPGVDLEKGGKRDFLVEKPYSTIVFDEGTKKPVPLCSFEGSCVYTDI